MGRWKVAVYALGLVVALSGGAWGQRVRHANAFLQVGRAAGHEALGRTLGAEAYGPMLGGVNPASLADAGARHVLATSYSHQYGGMGLLWSGSYAYQLGDGRGVEAILVYYGVRDIPNTLRWVGPDGRMDDRRVTRFDVSDYAALLSYGHRLPLEGLSLGGSLKLVYRHAGGFATGYGVGFEAGLRYARGGWGAGAVLHDPTTSWTFWDIHRSRLNPPDVPADLNPGIGHAEELTVPSLSLYGRYGHALPRGWHVGLAVRVHAVFAERGGLLAYLGPVGLAPSVGAWVRLPRILEVRLGVRQFQLYRTHRGGQQLQLAPSGGLGVRFAGVGLDYAITTPMSEASIRFTHLVSLSFSFGEPSSLGGAVVDGQGGRPHFGE